MKDGKKHILDSIRNSLRRSELPSEQQHELVAALRNPKPNTIPESMFAAGESLTELFIKNIKAAGATVEKLEGLSTVPESVLAYLAKLGTDTDESVRVAQVSELARLDWSPLSHHQVFFGEPEESDVVGVVPAFRAISETGTLVFTSGSSTPSRLVFTPRINIAVLDRSLVVRRIEDVWEQVRASPERWPSTLNMVTGVSLTGDIGFRLVKGAHGPKHLHVLVVSADQPMS